MFRNVWFVFVECLMTLMYILPFLDWLVGSWLICPIPPIQRVHEGLRILICDMWIIIKEETEKTASEILINSNFRCFLSKNILRMVSTTESHLHLRAKSCTSSWKVSRNWLVVWLEVTIMDSCIHRIGLHEQSIRSTAFPISSERFCLNSAVIVKFSSCRMKCFISWIRYYLQLRTSDCT
jgi:hypothetical protein